MSALPLSSLDHIILGALPSLFDAMGVDAKLTRADGEEIATRVIVATGVDPIGEYGERMATRHTLECPASDGAAIGDTWELAGRPTPDDPRPDPVVWRATALLAEDGLTQSFLIVPLEFGES
ncbi:MAG: hypothetical protein MZU84_03200 [Sphingobacterium sp.]|nr:hypothetical protein [Sphingobacterium sp.]